MKKILLMFGLLGLSTTSTTLVACGDKTLPELPQKIEVVNGDSYSFDVTWSTPTELNTLIVDYQAAYDDFYSAINDFHNALTSEVYNNLNLAMYNLILHNLQLYANLSDLSLDQTKYHQDMFLDLTDANKTELNEYLVELINLSSALETAIEDYTNADEQKPLSTFKNVDLLKSWLTDFSAELNLKLTILNN